MIEVYYANADLTSRAFLLVLLVLLSCGIILTYARDRKINAADYLKVLKNCALNSIIELSKNNIDIYNVTFSTDSTIVAKT